MKKALALVLALVMVLSMAVSAFAEIKLIELKEDKGAAKKYDVSFEDEDLFVDFLNDKKMYLVSGEGGTWYAPIKDDYKTVDVTVDNDFVTAELVDYDPETMEGGEKVFEIEFAIFGKDGQISETQLAAWVKGYNDEKGLTEDKAIDEDTTDYADLKAVADWWNGKNKTQRLTVKATSNAKLLKFTVADNFTVDYKEAKVKVTATGKYDETTGKYDKKTYTVTLTIISDVAIYEHNAVVYAAEEEDALVVGERLGYSAYLSKGNYGLTETYEEMLNRYYPATVIPTTGFRAIAGKEIVVDAAAKGIEVEVTIPEVAAGQKGVNFAFRTSKEFVDDTDWLTMFQKGKKSFSFGFKGQQVIASDYTIDVDLGIDYYQLRQLFRAKLEEEDVLTFYVLKDGKAFEEIVVDFMTVDDSENVEFTIEGKAGTNLGYYTITLTAPAAEEAGETNPDTGAESMIGVVAAMAVVTLASAAAISLKK